MSSAHLIESHTRGLRMGFVPCTSPILDLKACMT
jgi:hypothetical protein